MSKDISGTADKDGLLSSDNWDITECWIDQVVVLEASGAVDALTAPNLRDAIRAASVKASSGIVVDLSKVDFLASAGMSVLIAAHNDLAANVRFAVVANGGATSRPLILVGIDTVIPLYRTLDEGLRYIRRE